MYSNHRPPLDLSHLADDLRLTVELRSVAASARRRATRDGDQQIDTAHLLHSLLEIDPTARAACDAGTGRVDRVLGYLVQRSIGYGLRWRGSVEDSGALPVVQPAHATGWSPSAGAALRNAVTLARRRGRPQADGIDLLDALAADPACRAVEVLRAAGLDVSGFRDDGPVAS
ncbi:Clp protease N-terminal domain-containing protein [Actinacidiphila alni]|uniref:Clp protease N-terminal domain-containing protein n=1 Tax=Actinacidiphila alni TaxID=380248 RepID=UPI0033E70E5C